MKNGEKGQELSSEELESLKARFKELLAHNRYVLKDCGICGDDQYYEAMGDQLYYKTGCSCLSNPYRAAMEPRTWESLDFYFDPKHGHLKYIVPWVAKNGGHQP
ncbi:MAG: hypothetical protein MUP21_13525 [Dehalococcoidia bacterium]|nr:hypothetical protein [Dehalococcoidia bacterium]